MTETFFRKASLLWALILALTITACTPGGNSSNQTPSRNVVFESNIGAEFTGYTISFEYPRELEVGYFSDSGAFGWMIADADPQEVFWSANQTGDEISILLMLSQENDEFAGQTPAQLLDQSGQGVPPDADILEFTEGKKQVVYYFQSGKFQAAVVAPNVFMILFGSYPAEKEGVARDGVETILHSLEFHDANGKDYSAETVWGTRHEGALGAGGESKGYLPLASASSWEVKSASENITLSINAAPEAELTVDILGKDGKSILPDGGFQFTGSLEKRAISLPGGGTYTIRILPQADWYGWYNIQIE